jgi:esterase
VSVSLSSQSQTKSLATDTAVQLKWCDFSSGNDNKENSGEAPPLHTNTPVILLHGLLGSKRNFASIASSLDSQLQQKRRIIGLDLRNHGENHHDYRENMGYRDMAQDVLAFMDSQSLPTAVLVGHSMGGKVAQSVALLEPDRVQGLVVLDIAPVTYTVDEPHWKAVYDIVQVLNSIQVFPGVTKRDVDLQLREAVPDPALRAFLLTNLDVPAGRWKIHLKGIAAQLGPLAGFLDIDDDTDADTDTDANTDTDTAKHQYQYQGDTFFIHGGQSRFVRHAYMESIQNHFPNHM